MHKMANKMQVTYAQSKLNAEVSSNLFFIDDFHKKFLEIEKVSKRMLIAIANKMK